MNLYDKLNENFILLPMESSNKLEAFQELLYHLENIDILSETKQLYTSIVNKEETLPSAAGRGIAYPNFISSQITGLVCVLGISKTGLEFNAPDGQLCHLILLTLSSEDEPCEHRKFITRFSTMFKDPKVRYSLIEAGNKNEIVKIIEHWEKNEAKMDDLN
jgi:mannitol/fructose-specific phosphotransferase system IIA component (Ntr-type)